MAAGRSGCQGKGMSDKDEKAERLAAALRENLRRRKAQARHLDTPRDPEKPQERDQS
jgi:hypothetical protein